MSKVETSPKWADVAGHLDPMMSKDDFEQVRTKFFQDVILPRIPRGQDSQALFKEFQRRTERTPLLSVPERAVLQGKVFATEALKTMLPPGRSDISRMVGNKLQQQSETFSRMAERDGPPPNIAKGLGRMVGDLPLTLTLFAGLDAAAIPIVGKLTQVLSVGAKSRAVLAGGLSFAAYDALMDKTGNRLQAGVKGFGTGMLWNLPLVPFIREAGLAKTIPEAEKLVERAFQEPASVPNEVHEAIAKKLVADAQTVTRQEVLPNSIVRNPRIRGITVSLLPKEGQGVHSIEVRPGRESDALAQIRKAQDSGMEFNALHFNPNSEARAYRFLREARDSELWKYEDSMLVEVQKGMAENFAKQARSEGIPASAATDSHVELHVKREEVSPEHEALKERAYGPLNQPREIEEKTLVQDLDRSVAEAKADVPKMPIEKAKELAAHYGYDPEKVDLEAIRNTGEAELARLMEVRDRTRQSGGEFDPFGRHEAKAAVPLSSTISYHGTSPENAEKILEEGLVDKFKGYTKEDLIDLGHPKEDFEKIPKGRQPFIFTTQSLLDATTYAGPEGAGIEEAPRVVFQLEHGEALSEIPGEIVHAQPLGPSSVKRMFIDKEFAKSERGVSLLEKAKSKGVVVEEISMKDLLRQNPNFGTKFATTLPLPKGGVLSFDPRKTRSVVETLRSAGVGQALVPGMKISLHPFRAQIEVPQEVLDRLTPGAKAATYTTFREALTELGIKPPWGMNDLYPAVIVTKKSSLEDRFHEFLHAAAVKAGVFRRWGDMIPRESRLHAFSIASRLEKLGAYEGRSFTDLLDEVFAYAAEGVRYSGSKAGGELLEQLTKWDGSEAHIRALVKGTAENILEHSRGRMDTISERILQRKMKDLIRRGDPNISYNIQSVGESARWNPESLSWMVPDETGTVRHLKNVDEVWDFVLGKDISDAAPSFSQTLEMLGIRGPMSVVDPVGKPPLPTVGIPPEQRWRGWSGASGWFRPFLPWVATTDTKINRAIAKRGEAFPLFDKVKAVDSQVREGDRWLGQSRDKYAEIMKGVPDKKVHDYFTVLTYEPKHFGEAASKYNLSPKDIERVRALETWLTDFRDDTGIQPFQWLREIYPRLHSYNFAPEAFWTAKYDPKSAGFWEKAVRERGLEPSDTHLGRWVHWLLREGFEKKFTDTPLRELQKLIDLKVGEAGFEKDFLGKGLKGPLQNYINYVRGIPDQTQVVINQGMKDFVGFLQDKLKQINTHLPAGMKIPGAESNISPRLLQRFMVLTYASGLGLRPAIAVRDGLQVLSTTLPVLGTKKFSRGMELMFSQKGRVIVDEAGGFLTRHNIGELYGDIFGEIPTEGRVGETLNRFANLMMSPSRWGHNFSRGVTFLGEYDSALKSIRALREGKMTQDQFLKETSLWFMDSQVSSKLLLQAQGKEDLSSIAKRIALEAVDLTQWPFRRGTQPAALRTGLGRIFGQFGMWPANYADFLARLAKKSGGGEFRSNAVRAAGLWVASNYAATRGMEGLGADVGKWYFLSPAGYSPSMHFELVKDLAIAPEETDEGRAARKRILEYPLNFIPARVELENILRVMEDQPEIGATQGALDPKLLRVLGFKPSREMPEMTPEELAQYELGFKGVRAPIR